MTEIPDEFAFGDNMLGDCGCPAVVAGFNPSQDDSLVVAEFYDDVVRELGYANEDVDTSGKFKTKVYRNRQPIPADHAEEAWLEATEHVIDRYGEDSNFANVAVEIAETLGWK